MNKSKNVQDLYDLHLCQTIAEKGNINKSHMIISKNKNPTVAKVMYRASQSLVLDMSIGPNCVPIITRRFKIIVMTFKH